MTFSIVARCTRTGQLGVAAATAVPAVGTLLTWAYAGAGAVATQAWINPYLGIRTLWRLREGWSAQRAVDDALSGDPDRHIRQLAAVDSHGGVAAWTGERCTQWAGHRSGPGFCVQGNILENSDTLDAMYEAYERHLDQHLVERLLLALEAGDAVGGDRRGCTSATIYIVEAEEYPLWDIRVDDHPTPMQELRRLFGVFARDVVPQIRRLPTRRDPHGKPDLEHGTGMA